VHRQRTDKAAVRIRLAAAYEAANRTAAMLILADPNRY
jgi:hypothetical protein